MNIILLFNKRNRAPPCKTQQFEICIITKQLVPLVIALVNSKETVLD